MLVQHLKLFCGVSPWEGSCGLVHELRSSLTKALEPSTLWVFMRKERPSGYVLTNEAVQEKLDRMYWNGEKNAKVTGAPRQGSITSEGSQRRMTSKHSLAPEPYYVTRLLSGDIDMVDQDLRSNIHPHSKRPATSEFPSITPLPALCFTRRRSHCARTREIWTRFGIVNGFGSGRSLEAGLPSVHHSM